MALRTRTVPDAGFAGAPTPVDLPGPPAKAVTAPAKAVTAPGKAVTAPGKAGASGAGGR